ncbi:hypothetical protein ACQJBY_059709 [Aegilops geniculata]
MPTRCRLDRRNPRSPPCSVQEPEQTGTNGRSAAGGQHRCRSTSREAQGHRHRRRSPGCRRKHARTRASRTLAASSTPRSSTDPATDRDQLSNHQEVWCSTLEEGLDRSIQERRSCSSSSAGSPAASKQEGPCQGRRLLLLLAGDDEEYSFSFSFCTQMRQCSWHQRLLLAGHSWSVGRHSHPQLRCSAAVPRTYSPHPSADATALHYVAILQA